MDSITADLLDALERMAHMAECNTAPGPNTLEQARAAITKARSVTPPPAEPWPCFDCAGEGWYECPDGTGDSAGGYAQTCEACGGTKVAKR